MTINAVFLWCATAIRDISEADHQSETGKSNAEFLCAELGRLGVDEYDQEYLLKSIRPEGGLSAKAQKHLAKCLGIEHVWVM